MLRIVRVLICANLALAGWSLWPRHEWWVSLAYVIWAINCWTWLGTLKVQQRTRDAGRVLESAVLAVLEGAE